VPKENVVIFSVTEINLAGLLIINVDGLPPLKVFTIYSAAVILEKSTSSSSLN
jgi:hypothetical protein